MATRTATRWLLRLLLSGLLLHAHGACVGIQGAPSDQQQARQILEASGVRGGLVVHFPCGDGRLTAALRAGDAYIVQGLNTDAASVEKARATLHGVGAYGAVTAAPWDGRRLPYVDNLVNLIVAEGPGQGPEAEMLRALAPNGVAYVKRDGRWSKQVKPRPKEMDEWTHYLHDPSNNAVAHDSLVGPPRHYQWIGSPRWARHHDHMASTSAMVSSGGRVFYIFDEGPTASILAPTQWMVIARDAFNGTVLWKRPFEKWHTHLWPLKSGPAQLPRRLVAVGDTVYVTLGLDAPLTALDAATGKTLRTYEGTRATEEILLADGTLYLLVNPTPEAAEYANISEVRRDANTRVWDGSKRRILAVDAGSGQILWRKESPVLPLSMAVDAPRVYFHDGERILSLDCKSGSPVWTSDPVSRRRAIPTFFAPTLVAYQDVVLFSGGSEMSVETGGGDNKMVALAAETGKLLWSADHPSSGYKSPEDVLVSNGLVWCGATTNPNHSGVMTGRDPRTGEVKVEFGPDVQTYWFHHRCHRGKATDRYLLMSRTGIEFVDTAAKKWILNHWVRGGCVYGVMPCNGMIYTPPHDCACYLESKLYGFGALAAAASTRRVPESVPDEGRLERGPAYGDGAMGRVGDEESGGRGDEVAAEWPTYRQNAARSGRTTVAVPTALKRSWETKLGGRLTSPVVAGGRAYVAQVDTHTLYALDAGSGKVLWRMVAGGRIDSPPTIDGGRVLFGCADGWVYSLRAADGALAWRFRAAPDSRQMMAFEQLESAWPVSGSVLVQDGSVYCVAGRSMFVDGGLRFLRLDAKTGRKLAEKVVDDRDPQGADLQSYVKVLDMPAALPDVLSSDGKQLYMRSLPFDFEGNRQQLAPLPVTEQPGEGVHLFSPTGMLDDSWFHRSYWVYGRSFASGWDRYYLAGKTAPAGRMLVYDDTHVYGFGRKPQYYRWTTPMEYHLFATSTQIPPAQPAPKPKAAASCVSVPNSASLDPTNSPLTVEAWVKAANPAGVILARGGPIHGYALFLAEGKPHFAIRADNALGTVSGKDAVGSEWVHLAGVLGEDKKLRLYVNGALAAEGDGPGFLPAPPAQATEIGSDEGGAVADYDSPFGFTGLIDEVRVTHRALKPEEIRRRFTNPGEAPAKDPKLVLALSFDAGDAADASGSGNNGKLEGAQAAPGKVGRAFRFAAEGGRRASRPVLPSVIKHTWTQEIPFHVRAMVLAGKTLFIAGPPDLVDEEDAQKRLSDPEVIEKLAAHSQALAGRKGGVLWAVSTADGGRLAEYPLEAPPVFDGMAAAGQSLYFTTVDGKVVCMGGAK